MDEVSQTKCPMKKFDFGRDDLVRDGFGASSPVSVSGPHDNFNKLPKKNRRTGSFVWSGAVVFIFLFTDKKTRVGRVSGNTGIFFFFFFFYAL